MTHLPDTIKSSELASLPINPSISDTERSIVVGALNVLTQSSKFDSVLLSPDDSYREMPNQHQYIAGDTVTTITPLRSAGVGMLELQIMPFEQRKTFTTIVALAFEDTGLRLQQDIAPQVIVEDASQHEQDAPFRISGSRAVKMQQIILDRTARNLFEESRSQ